MVGHHGAPMDATTKYKASVFEQIEEVQVLFL